MNISCSVGVAKSGSVPGSGWNSPGVVIIAYNAMEGLEWNGMNGKI